MVLSEDMAGAGRGLRIMVDNGSNLNLAGPNWEKILVSVKRKESSRCTKLTRVCSVHLDWNSTEERRLGPRWGLRNPTRGRANSPH